MAKKTSVDGKSSNKGGAEKRNYSNNSGKKSYQPTTDRTTKPPKKDGK
tara:strand:- start:743 stop:886 length:144 start_codon:yes stop_codon:yes gene_type:complete